MSPSPVVPAPGARLNGWKEIAVHFGRGVRTVQRWEKAFGMPVHRIGTGRGENVHAFTDELDAWLVSASRTRDLADQPGDAEPPEINGAGADLAGRPTPGPVATSGWSGRRRWLWGTGLSVTLAVLFAIVITVVWGRQPVRKPNLSALPQPSIAKIDGNALRVYDADQRFLWKYEFDRPLPESTGQRFPGFAPNLVIQDLDGDGARELLVFGPGREPRWPLVLYCFDAAGAVRWTRTPTSAVRFGDRDFRPPWSGLGLYVTGAGRDTALWAAWTHVESGLFPCLLERLSPGGGTPLSEFWSAGYVTALMAGTVQGRPSILVGAANNDTHGASLAVFDADKVSGSAPAEHEDKICHTSTPGSPRAFLVFPRLDLSAMTDGNAFVHDIRLGGGGEVSVWVGHAAPAGYGAVSYRLDASLRPVSAEVGAEYQTLHRTYQARLGHPFRESDRAAAWPVLVYDGTRFVPVSGAITR
jgi:hypothetical protein